MEDAALEEIIRQKRICEAAGCTDNLVTNTDCEERRKDIRPSVVIELLKVAVSIGVPLIVFYGNFKALEAKVEMILRGIGKY